jgi:hypothetical protein
MDNGLWITFPITKLTELPRPLLQRYIVNFKTGTKTEGVIHLKILRSYTGRCKLPSALLDTPTVRGRASILGTQDGSVPNNESLRRELKIMVTMQL